MQKLNLTNTEVELLKGIIPKRIKWLQDWSTPEEYGRAMWPVSVDAKELEEYTARHKRRQDNIKLYQSILKKLG